MGAKALAGAVFGASGDVFARPLRGLVLATALGAGALLAGLTWAAFRFGAPWAAKAAGGLAWAAPIGEFLMGAGVVVLAVLLWPAASMAVGGMLFDAAAERVERTRFAGDPPGSALPFTQALANTAKIALPALALNILAAPLLFVPGLNLILFLTLNGALMSREYFSLAALRFQSWDEVKRTRRAHRGVIFLAGLTCAALLYVPVLNFIAPLYGAALMVRLNKALSA